MTAATIEEITTDRRDNRVYHVERKNALGQKRIVKRFWHQLDNAERASIIESENRQAYNNLFCIYDY